MKYVVTCMAGILSGTAGFELAQRLQWTELHQRMLIWLSAIVMTALACASLWR